MAQITRGTTPRIEVDVDTDLSDYTCYLSIGKAGEDMLTVSTTECEVVGDKSIVRFDLSQEDTLKLPKGNLKMQVRSVKDSHAIATEMMPITVLDVIHEGVVEDVD